MHTLTSRYGGKTLGLLTWAKGLLKENPKAVIKIVDLSGKKDIRDYPIYE